MSNKTICTQTQDVIKKESFSCHQNMTGKVSSANEFTLTAAYHPQ